MYPVTTDYGVEWLRLRGCDPGIDYGVGSLIYSDGALMLVTTIGEMPEDTRPMVEREWTDGIGDMHVSHYRDPSLPEPRREVTLAPMPQDYVIPAGVDYYWLNESETNLTEPNALAGRRCARCHSQVWGCHCPPLADDPYQSSAEPLLIAVRPS